MAMQVNMDAWRGGSDAYWKSVARSQWDEENTRRVAAEDRAQQEFGLRLADREENIKNANELRSSFSPADSGNSRVSGFLEGYRADPQEQAPQAAPVNPTLANATTAPNAVTNNLMTQQGAVDPALVGGLRNDYTRAGKYALVPGGRPGANQEAQRIIAGELAAAQAGVTAPQHVRTPDALREEQAQMLREIQRAESRLSRGGLKPKEAAGTQQALNDLRAIYQSSMDQPTQAAPVQAPPQVAPEPQQAPQAAGLSMGATPEPPAAQARRPMQEPEADPRLAQLKLLAYNAMRKGDVATATRLAESYHNLRLDGEMGRVASHVMQSSPDELNAIFQRLGGDLNTGLQGVLLEQKFDPATGMSVLAVGDKKVPISRTDAAALLSGIYAIQKGNVAAGYSRIAAVNKEIADLATGQNKMTEAVSKSGTEANYKARYLGALGNKNDAAAEKQQRGLEFANRIDGVLEGFQAAVQAGPEGAQAAKMYAAEYDQLRASAGQYGLKTPPSLSALTNAQREPKGESSKPVKIEEAGQPYLVNGREMVTNGRGGYTVRGGVMPDQFPARLKAAGVPEFAWGDFVLSDDGSMVSYLGVPHALDELPKLAKDAAGRAAMNRSIAESQRSRANPPAQRAGLATRAAPEYGVPWPAPNRTGLQPN